jgi:Ala-tRNA(Pro) deacylase
MKATKKQDIYNILKEMNIDYSVTEHKPVYTIEEMNDLGMENIDHVIKNLFIRDDKKKNYYLVLVQKDKTVNLNKLKETINSRRLSFASEEDLEKYLGLKKGAVSPLGIVNDENKFVKVIIDRDIKNLEFIGVHPIENTATVWINVEDLQKLIKSNGNYINFVNM